MKAAADVCALPPRWPRQRHSGNKGVELKSREKMVAHHLRRNVWRRLVFWWTRCFYCQTDFFGTWAFLISIKCHLGATGTLLSLVDWKTPRKVLLGRIHKHFANNGILMSTHLWLIKQCLNVSAPTAVWLGSFPSDWTGSFALHAHSRNPSDHSGHYTQHKKRPVWNSEPSNSVVSTNISCSQAVGVLGMVGCSSSGLCLSTVFMENKTSAFLIEHRYAQLWNG